MRQIAIKAYQRSLLDSQLQLQLQLRFQHQLQLQRLMFPHLCVDTDLNGDYEVRAFDLCRPIYRYTYMQLIGNAK